MLLLLNTVGTFETNKEVLLCSSTELSCEEKEKSTVKLLLGNEALKGVQQICFLSFDFRFPPLKTHFSSTPRFQLLYSSDGFFEFF